MKFARQYASKLAGNVVSLVAGMVVLGLVPRTLGPESYGRYEFLTSFFLQVKGYFDAGTSTCFYTRLSQRPGDAGLVVFYRKWFLSASLLMIGGATLLAGTSLGERVWPGEGPMLVGLAACFAVITWWLDITRKMVDAWHLTVRGEMLYASARVVAVSALAATIWLFGLRLEGYFLYQIAALLLAVALLTHLLKRRALAPAGTPPAQPQRAYAREFWDYSHPLLAYASVCTLGVLVDRWVLQTQAGATEQGYFGLAYQVGAVCFLFTSAMTQLLSREFAVAWDLKDMGRMAAMFRRAIPMSYTMAAYFSVFIACHAADVVWLLGGSAWEQGSLVMAVLTLYPMHQTYGQLSGSVYYATGQTRLYRNIGIVGTLTGLPLMLWLVLPTESGGMGLGAAGLSLQIVLTQFIFVNVGLWFNVRLMSLNFWKFFAHQLIVPTTLLLCSFASSTSTSTFAMSRLARLILDGFVYTALVAVVILLVPQLIGLQRGEIGAILRKVPGAK
jgi:O-antigen/teichoic acid export membrane protein